MCKISVITPVFNRLSELQLALTSLQQQTLTSFECLIVDDASSVDIASVVAKFDRRFRYIRSDRNLGPSGARLLGYRAMQGEFMVQLDSDNRLYPWALERACRLLDKDPTVSGVAGLYVFPDGLRCRVQGGARVVEPADYVRGVRSPVDQVGVVRRQVVEEWLVKRAGYYSAEFHQWLTYGLNHRHLVVDEPWGFYSEASSERVSSGLDDRNVSDVRLFVEEHRPMLERSPCIPLDEYLCDQWVRLRWGNRPEAGAVAEWMAERGLRRSFAVRRKLKRRIFNSKSSVFWL